MPDHNYDAMMRACTSQVPSCVTTVSKHLSFPCRLHRLSQVVSENGASSCHQFVKRALQPLVSLLLSQLTKQEEGQDLDENMWNVSMAAGTCLALIAQTVGDDVVGLTMPYVQVCLLVTLSPWGGACWGGVLEPCAGWDRCNTPL